MPSPALTPQQQAAAELVETRRRNGERPIADVLQELASGPLAGFCSHSELRAWHLQWKRQQDKAEVYAQGMEIPVDPESLDGLPEVEKIISGPGVDASAVDTAGAFLDFADKRLARCKVRWKEKDAALRRGEIIEQRHGAGRERQEDGRVVDWILCAVLIRAPDGKVRKILPECKKCGLRPAGWGGYRDGAVRVRTAVAVSKEIDPNGMAAAVGSLVLVMRGEAGGMRKQNQLAAACNLEKATISARCIRMTRAAGTAALHTIRCRGKRAKEIRQKKTA